PSVAASASDVFTLVVDVGAGTTGTISNTATVTTATADPTPGNNSATASTTASAPLSADLSVSKSAAATVTSGNPLTYTITVGNAGPNAAATATLDDTLPAGTTFASLASAAGWTCTTPAVAAPTRRSSDLPSVAASASDVFTLVVDVGAGTTGTVSNTAT